MKRIPALLAILLVLLACLWFAFRTREAALPAPERAQAPAAGTPAEPLESARSETPRAPAELPAAAAVQPADGRAEIRGRFLFEDSRPAAGVAVALWGAAANAQRVAQSGPAVGWENLKGSSDAEGRFSLRFDPPRSSQFGLKATLAGVVPASWRWPALEPGKLVDLGSIVLRRGGTLIGTVQDAQGKPTGFEWHVFARETLLAEESARSAVQVWTTADPLSGAYRLEDVPPGQVEAFASAGISARVESRADVRAGEETRLDFVYDGPDPQRNLTLNIRAQPMHLFNDLDPFELRGPGGYRHTIEPRTLTRSLVTIADLAPGEYSLEIRDPRFVPLVKEGLHPGEIVELNLVGNASLELELQDAASGAPVANATLELHPTDERGRHNPIRLHEASAPWPERGRFEGITPVDQALLVHAEGYAPVEAALLAWLPGEVRKLQLQLSRGATIRGLVLRGEDRKPAPEAEVLLLAGAQDPIGVAWEMREDENQPGVRATRTDAQGAFSFAGVVDGSWRVRAYVGARMEVQKRVQVESGRDPAALELQLPEGGWLEGRVLAPPGANVARMTIGVRLEDPGARRNPPRGRAGALADNSLCPLGPDGSFRLGPFPAEGCVVYVMLPKHPYTFEDGMSILAWGDSVQLGTLDLEPGKTLHRDFDLGDRFPGTLEVDARVGGRPLAGLSVSVVNLDGRNTIATTLVLDAQGRSAGGMVLPGRYRILLSNSPVTWAALVSPECVVEAGKPTRLVCDVSPVDGQLRLVQRDSQHPIANERLLPACDDVRPLTFAAVQTDAQGRVKLRLVAGSYRINFEQREPGQWPPDARFEWTDRGAVPEVVLLGP